MLNELTMTKEEYRKRLSELKEEFEKKTKELAKEYALSNNPYKVGDIIKDSYQIIKVDRVSVLLPSITSDYPQCVFYGTQLTSKLVPKKKQDKSPRMFQRYVIKKLN